MKRVLSILIIVFLTSLQLVYATEASKYASNQYSENIGKNVKLSVKKEHTQECYQKIGNFEILSITYGYGNLKVKGQRRLRVSYICLRDKDCQIVWSCIIPR